MAGHSKNKDQNAAKAENQEAIIARVREKWGKKFDKDGNATDYTIDELRYLEKEYKTRAEEYKGAITARIDLALKEIAFNSLEWRKCVGSGDSNGAKKYSDAIKVVMDREAMKAADTKPVEQIKAGSLAANLEKVGATKNGILTLDGVVNYIKNDKGNYQMSKDCLDLCLLALINTYRINEGMEELYTLPDNARPGDPLGEFAKERSPEEVENVMNLGMNYLSKG